MRTYQVIRTTTKDSIGEFNTMAEAVAYIQRSPDSYDIVELKSQEQVITKEEPPLIKVEDIE